MRAGQVQHDPTDRADDMHADLQQRESQPRHLAPRQRRAVGAQLGFLHQDVRRGGQSHAQLIGPA